MKFCRPRESEADKLKRRIMSNVLILTEVQEAMRARYKAMLLEGVDLMRTGGFLSAAHTEQDVDATCEAFARALGRLGREGYLSLGA